MDLIQIARNLGDPRFNSTNKLTRILPDKLADQWSRKGNLVFLSSFTKALIDLGGRGKYFKEKGTFLEALQYFFL